MTEHETLQMIATRFGTRVTATQTRDKRLWVTVEREGLQELISWLKDELGYYHVSTITGLDSGELLEALYHLNNGSTVLTVRTSAPKTDPRLPTITPVIAGAVLYERELQDLLGFVIENHPDPRRYILPDDWPAGVYPLRKDYQPETVKESN